MIKSIHIIGSGLAGLSSAIHLLKKNRKINIYEASTLFGGRCRSYKERDFKCVLDNGNHLIIKAYKNTFKYIKEINAEKELITNSDTLYHFIDISKSTKWTVRPYTFIFPWWVFINSYRPADVSFFDFIKSMKIFFARNNQTVCDVLDSNSLIYKRFWKPFTIAVLNTHPKEASAKLLWGVVSKTLFKGTNSLKPYTVKKSLDESLIKPALKKINSSGGELRRNHRLKKIIFKNNFAKELIFQNKKISLGEKDLVVLAFTPNVLNKILPDVTTPKKTNCILNIHFKIDKFKKKVNFPKESFFLGVTGGLTDWIFKKNNILSVTISAANKLDIYDNEKISKIIWEEIKIIFKLDNINIPKYKVIKEKMATFVQSPEEVWKKPKMQTKYSNIFLAGDWIDNGLPATIEGAVTSGYKVANYIKNI